MNFGSFVLKFEFDDHLWTIFWDSSVIILNIRRVFVPSVVALVTGARGRT